MSSPQISPLASVERRLRSLLPADLYATAWMGPSAGNLTRVFEHLRTLHRILHDYLPRQVVETPPQPGQIHYEWQEGTLMFTDLAGFTRLVELHAAAGREGAETLLGLLNAYFTEMLAITSKSGGNLLEFTGDALLVQFPADERRRDTAQAVRAGLRMQRAMAQFARIETAQGTCSLGMRVGIHFGRYLAADMLNFPLLSDAGGQVAAQYGALQADRSIQRSAYVVDKAGIVRFASARDALDARVL